MRRRRVGLTTLAAVVDERAFGFAGDVAVAFRVRGSMFSLFSSSQLAYARCCWGLALVRFRPGLPFCGAHFLAASSGPIFHLRCARTAGSGPFFTRARTVGGQLSVRATVFKRPPTRPRERESVTFARLFGRSATPRCRLGPAPRKSAGLEGACQLGPRGRSRRRHQTAPLTPHRRRRRRRRAYVK